MSKDIIKKLVREGLLDRKRPIAEKKRKDVKSEPKQGEKQNKKTTKRDYEDIKNKLDKSKGSPYTQVAVMTGALGIPDDEAGTNRGLFNKKLNQDTNDEGGVYQWDENEMSAIRGWFDKHG